MQYVLCGEIVWCVSGSGLNHCAIRRLNSLVHPNHAAASRRKQLLDALSRTFLTKSDPLIVDHLNVSRQGPKSTRLLAWSIQLSAQCQE